ncbi:MAG: hypothetical protein IIC67_02710 [Thaumarchaeota archaeon]|nr:hypothetical protein [Nitrososphaerota archaeon]
MSVTQPDPLHRKYIDEGRLCYELQTDDLSSGDISRRFRIKLLLKYNISLETTWLI